MRKRGAVARKFELGKIDRAKDAAIEIGHEQLEKIALPVTGMMSIAVKLGYLAAAS